MTALAKIDRRNFGRWQRCPDAHDPCLTSFRCTPVPSEATITDLQLRWKGVLSFFDSVTDPLSGTEYQICSHPKRPTSTGAYFYRVGRHMALVMAQSNEGIDGRREHTAGE